MLSAEERRRLDEIERLLELDDPRFVARMRSERGARRRWSPWVVYSLLWMIALVAGAFVSWVAGVVLVIFGTAVGAVVLAIATYRRRRTRGG